MPPELNLLIRLQQIDDRILQLSREIAALPKHIFEIEKKLHSHQRRLEADRAALAANQKERKRLEGEIQVQEQKVSKLQNQMSEAKTNEQYRAFQNEIDFCKTEIRKFEDRILLLMDESEPLDKNVKLAEGELDKEQQQVNSEKADARTRTEVDRNALGELNAERTQLVSRLDQALYGRYERIRRARAGVAVSEALNGRCSMCQMTIRPQFWQELRKGDQIMACESCSRILYYHPPVTFEELTGQAAPTASE
jgi:uncharacterized protein